MEVASRSAPMKMQPSFRAANAALAWLSISGSQSTCPGAGEARQNQYRPGVVQLPLPAGRGDPGSAGGSSMTSSPGGSRNPRFP